MTSSELSLLWAAFAQTDVPADRSLRVFETPVSTNYGAVLLAMDFEDRRHLMVPTDSHSAIAEDRTGTGVQILQWTTHQNGSAMRYTDVTCLRPDLNEIFDLLISDILNALPGRRDPVTVCRTVLERWRELLAQARGAKLGSDALSGLFAELVYVLRIVTLDPGAFGVWRGPFKAPHDFARTTNALEVKATRSRIGRFCEVHGPGQLLPPPGGQLHLAFIRLEDVDTGASVPDLIEQISDCGISRQAFMEALAETGYDPRDAEEYRRFRFRICEERVYLVDERFPRVIPASFTAGVVPNGVVDIVYRIDLSLEPPLPVSSMRVEEIIRTLAGVSDVQV